jgi:hypothetical protein
MLCCYILCSEILVKVDCIGVKVEGRSDRPGKVKVELIDNKSRVQSTRGSKDFVWKPTEDRMEVNWWSTIKEL